MVIYKVIHIFLHNGGYGDAVPVEEPIAIFSTEEKAKDFVKKYEKPHIYDELYDFLTCGKLTIEEIELDKEPDRESMWWLYNDVFEDDTIWHYDKKRKIWIDYNDKSRIREDAI